MTAADRSQLRHADICAVSEPVSPSKRCASRLRSDGVIRATPCRQPCLHQIVTNELSPSIFRMPSGWSENPAALLRTNPVSRARSNLHRRLRDSLTGTEDSKTRPILRCRLTVQHSPTPAYTCLDSHRIRTRTSDACNCKTSPTSDRVLTASSGPTPRLGRGSPAFSIGLAASISAPQARDAERARQSNHDARAHSATLESRRG